MTQWGMRAGGEILQTVAVKILSVSSPSPKRQRTGWKENSLGAEKGPSPSQNISPDPRLVFIVWQS